MSIQNHISDQMNEVRVHTTKLASLATQLYKRLKDVTEMASEAQKGEGMFMGDHRLGSAKSLLYSLENDKVETYQVEVGDMEWKNKNRKCFIITLHAESMSDAISLAEEMFPSPRYHSHALHFT